MKSKEKPVKKTLRKNLPKRGPVSKTTEQGREEMNESSVPISTGLGFAYEDSLVFKDVTFWVNVTDRRDGFWDHCFRFHSKMTRAEIAQEVISIIEALTKDEKSDSTNEPIRSSFKDRK